MSNQHQSHLILSVLAAEALSQKDTWKITVRSQTCREAASSLSVTAGRVLCWMIIDFFVKVQQDFQPPALIVSVHLCMRCMCLCVSERDSYVQPYHHSALNFPDQLQIQGFVNDPKSNYEKLANVELWCTLVVVLKITQWSVEHKDTSWH